MKYVATLIGLLLLLIHDAGAQSNDILSEAGFGAAVAVTAGDVLVAEPLNARFSGKVYVYRKNPVSGKWIEEQQLEPIAGDARNGFGSGISASGDLAAIVAPGGDGIYVFRRGLDAFWSEETVLNPDPDRPFSEVAAEVAVASDRVFTTVLSDSGTVQVVIFERSFMGTAWSEATRVDLPTVFDVDLPRPIVASDDVAFVGLPGIEGGAVFEIRNTGEEWNVTRILQDVSADDASLFGVSLALAGDVLIVGAPESNDGLGAVYVFRPAEMGNLTLSQTLTPPGDDPAPLFGSVVSAYGGSLVVGGYMPDTETGLAYVFESSPEGYRSVETIAGKTLEEEEAEFATAIASGDGVTVIGAMADLYGYGSAFVYESDGSTGRWMQTSSLKSGLSYRVETITGGEVKCENGKARAFDCSNVDVVSFLTNRDLGSDWGILTNDVWGWTDPETGREYAIVCTFDGTVFVDVSDPENPLVLGKLRATPGTRPNWWRDAKTYRNHAYIVADNAGDHGLQIFDLTQLREVVDPPVEFQETAHYGGFGDAHNIVINEATGFAYVVGINGGGTTCGGGSHMLDLKEPTAPKFVGCFAHEGTGQENTGYTHDAQCVVYHGPDSRFAGREICVAANETAISIADFTDKSNVVPIAVARYPTVSYAHQGWFTEDHRYYFQDDEADEINGITPGTRTLVWDMAQLDDPVLVDEYVSTNKATDHNLFIKGSYMYQSNYVSGLRIFDVSNPTRIEDAGYFDTVPWGDDRPGYGGSWGNYPFFKSGIIAVTSGEEGVFFLRRSEVAP